VAAAIPNSAGNEVAAPSVVVSARGISRYRAKPPRARGSANKQIGSWTLPNQYKHIRFVQTVTLVTNPTITAGRCFHSFIFRRIPFVIRRPSEARLDFLAGVYSRMTSKIAQSLLVLAVGGMMAIATASAQTQNSKTSGAGAGKHDPGHPRVNQVNARETRQQNRIGNGIKNGQLKPGQAARLERGEQRLQHNEKKDMAKDNGHLTKKDQRQLNHEANNMSKRIYKDKHPAK